MNKNRYHLEINYSQAIKKNERVCGDNITQFKTGKETIFIISDGIGSGIKANIASNLLSSQLIKMLEIGFSLRETINKIVKNMHKARSKDIPFSAFTIVKILNNLTATVYSYESPLPVFIEDNFAFIPTPVYHSVNNEIIAETELKLKKNNNIIIATDGITQAGMGYMLPHGWSIEGVRDYINKLLSADCIKEKIPDEIIANVKKISDNTMFDDATAALISLKTANVINILSGPPEKKESDEKYINDFIKDQGLKIICGSTTLEIYSRLANLNIKNTSIGGGYSKPPRYFIDGADIATEGCVVLNQVTNILDADINQYDPDSSVSEISVLLNAADIINFRVGKAQNPANKAIIFKQMGLLPRNKIIPRLIKKLKDKGKLVNTVYY